MKDQIDIQRKKLLAGNPSIDLIDSCRINHGILAFDNEQLNQFAQAFDNIKSEKEIEFFVPASGSGSRMFAKLYSFLNQTTDKEAREWALEFSKKLPSLAVFQELPKDIQMLAGKEEKLEELIGFILGEDGLNLGQYPKGLIPFHVYEDYITNPFQEHLLQGVTIAHNQARFHFTINKDFEAHIEESIAIQTKRDEEDYIVRFSEQNPETNSYAFDDQFEVAFDKNGGMIRRPAGHGALIHNLDSINADIVFIRNIDNMQHLDKAQTSIETRKALAGILLNFQAEVHNCLKKLDRGDAFSSSASAIHQKYDLRMDKEQLGNAEYVRKFFNRPIRICGMVKNEGEPGGGPFWVKNKGWTNRQIVEKSQIADRPEHLKLMETATHFNPVELVCAVKNSAGNKFKLLDYVNDDQYFIVHKTQEGRAIQYIEQPGLWNGAMANWLTLFVEIDSSCFSPVKTIMDLHKDAHLPN